MSTMTSILLSMMTLTVAPARASTCYKSATPLPVRDSRTAKPTTLPVVINVLWPDRADEVGALVLRAPRLKAESDLSCTTGQPGRCQIGGDAGKVTLLNQGDGVTLITHDGTLGIENDDGGEPLVSVVPGSGGEFSLQKLTSEQCQRIFGSRRSIVVFPK